MADAARTEFETPPNAPTILVRRWLAAPPARVFAAFTEPALLRRWWGGIPGSTLSVCEVDLRPGGKWRFVERMADGREVPFSGRFRSVEPPHRLVFTMRAEIEGFDASEHEEAATFEASEGGTRLTIISTFPGIPARDQWTASGAKAGTIQFLKRLEAVLTSSPDGAPPVDPRHGETDLKFERRIGAPPERVFAAWTDPKVLERWYGPEGFTTSVESIDPRPGGILRLTMQGPDGRRYPNRIRYVEVVPPERIVHRHEPEAGTVPGDFTTTITFRPDGDGTIVTLTLSFPTKALREQNIATYRSDVGGPQTLGRLAALMAVG